MMSSQSFLPPASRRQATSTPTSGWAWPGRGGAKQVCLTARHSGGFALWQTNTTGYGVRQSPYMGGTADLVQDFVASCCKFSVSPCLYFNLPGDEALEQQNRTADQYLATQLANVGEFSKAEKYFRHCIKLDKKSVPALFGLGKIMMHHNQSREAFDQFKLVTEIDATHYKALC